MVASIGKNWLGSETRPSVANTAVRPTSTGTTAATADPSTSRRITSVSTSAISPAFAIPELITLSSAFSVETPTSAT